MALYCLFVIQRMYGVCSAFGFEYLQFVQCTISYNIQVYFSAMSVSSSPLLSGTGSLLLRTVHILQSLMVRYPDLRLLVPGV